MKSKGNHSKGLDIRPHQSISLSHPIGLEFLQPKTPKQSIVTTLTSMMNNNQKNTPNPLCKIVHPIPDEFILLLHGNALRMYRYWENATHNTGLAVLCEQYLNFNAKSISCFASSKRLTQNGFFLIAEDEYSWQVEVLYFCSIAQTIQKIRTHKIPSKILTWSFVNSRQVVFWCENMRLYHYEITNSGLEENENIDSTIDIVKEAQKIEQQEIKKKKMEQGKSKSRSKSINRAIGKQKQMKSKYNFKLMYSQILGHRSMDEDKIIVLFYVLYEQNYNVARIRCKEILYPMEHREEITNNFSYMGFIKRKNKKFPTLEPQKQTHQIITSNTACPEILKVMKIIKIQQAYFFRFQSEVIVIQKKFQKYLAVDNIYKKDRQCFVQISQNNNLMACIVEKILQISQINFGQKKIQANMVDFVELKNQNEGSEAYEKYMKEKNYQKFQHQIEQMGKKNDKKDSKTQKPTVVSPVIKTKLSKLWISSHIHDPAKNIMIFIFQTSIQENAGSHNYLHLYFGEKVQKIKKLTQMAIETNNQEDLTKIQQIGQVIGVSQDDFYLNLWRNSDKSPQKIFSYLLKCVSFDKIVPELKNYLRKKAMTVVKLVRVLTQIQDIAMKELKKQLTKTNMINYFYINFIHRKFSLISSEYQMDERQFTRIIQISIYDLVFQIINKKIDPPPSKYSPWIAEKKEPPKINIIQILNAFKFPLLEDYGSFLNSVLQKFQQNDQIVKVIENFPEFLPNYPYLIQTDLVLLNLSALINKQTRIQTIKQSQFFSKIMPKQIQRQNAFLEVTLKELMKFYPTSSVMKMFENTLESYSIRNGKFISHMIISSTQDQYISNVNKIGGITLFLLVLQRLIKGAKKQRRKAKIHQLLQIMQKYHNLDEDTLFSLQIASLLYQLMLSYDIIESGVPLEKVYSSPIEKWIALFFLGNKQQKDIIFTQFMDIFPDNLDFEEAMRKFIKSEHCSRIELTILIDLVATIGSEFQRKNQRIIELIINGFCARIQLRDTAEANHFISHIKSVQLNSQLIRKVDHIQKMRLCLKIFQVFSMQNVNLQHLLDETILVIEQMMQFFFEGRMKKTHIILDKKQVLIVEQCKGLFKLLHFLRDNFFFQLNPEQLVVTYCKKLIQWQQFQQVCDLLYKSPFIDEYDLVLGEVIPKIQLLVIEKLYEDDEMLYDEDIKMYIRKVLDIDKYPENNVLAIHEEARLVLVELFESWGFTIKLSNLNIMCAQWDQCRDEAERQAELGGMYARPIMIQIIQTYAQNLNLHSLQILYRCFMSISEDTRNPQTKTDQFYNYCTKLSDVLMNSNRLEQASQIICIVNQKFQMNYHIMSQCMLRSVIKLYGNKHLGHNQILQNLIGQDESERQPLKRSNTFDQKFDLLQVKKKGFYPISMQHSFMSGRHDTQQMDQMEYRDKRVLSMDWRIIKKYIDYFVANWGDANQTNLNKIFNDFFSDHLDGYEEAFIYISPEICFKNHKHKITTEDLLWIVKKGLKQNQYTQHNIYYGYFFLSMGLTEPKTGFKEMDYLSYDHVAIYHILIHFKEVCEGNEKLYGVNYVPIIKEYLDAISRLILIRHEDDDEVSGNEDKKNMSSNRIDYSKASKIDKTDKPKDEGKQQKNIDIMNANLQSVRDMIKKGWYKSDPLSAIINKTSILLNQAIKTENKRRHTYHATIQNHDFNIKENMIKLKPKEEKISHSMMMGTVVDAIKGVFDKNNVTMSYDRFKNMKKHLKVDKNLSMTLGGDQELTERVIVDQLLGVIDRNSFRQKPKHNGRTQIPGLSDLILTSIKEMEEREKQKKGQQQRQQQQSYNQAVSMKLAESMQIDYNESIQVMSTIKKRQEMGSQAQFIQLVEDEQYESIACWSPDAILLQTSKIYYLEQVKFQKVIKMFDSLCVACSNTVQVLRTAQPENLEVSDQFLKIIFPLEYLDSQFGTWQENVSVIVDNISPILLTMQQKQIRSLASFLKQVSKIEYRKVAKDDWLNILAETGLYLLIQKNQFSNFEVARLDKIVKLFTKDYIKQNYNELLMKFNQNSEECRQLKKAFEDFISLLPSMKRMSHRS